jgi:thiamine-phosphate pyrophosphorylase
MSKAVSGLYAVTPEIADTAQLLKKVEAALRGGARIVQLRSKGADESRRRSLARQVMELCKTAGARFIVNDSVELARELDADGVHLGKDDTEPRVARALLGPAKLIGVSCYNQLPRAREAVTQGADYIAFGSFFPSATKPGAVRATLDLLRSARREISLPIVAIGGVSADNAGSLIAAGADAVAVVGGLFDAPDVENEARRIAALFQVYELS